MRYTPGMADSAWKSLRETTGLSQRAVERRLNWKRGHLSLIERGLPPSEEQAASLRAFYMNMPSQEVKP